MLILDFQPRDGKKYISVVQKRHSLWSFVTAAWVVKDKSVFAFLPWAEWIQLLLPAKGRSWEIRPMSYSNWHPNIQAKEWLRREQLYPQTPQASIPTCAVIKSIRLGILQIGDQIWANCLAFELSPTKMGIITLSMASNCDEDQI